MPARMSQTVILAFSEVSACWDIGLEVSKDVQDVIGMMESSNAHAYEEAVANTNLEMHTRNLLPKCDPPARPGIRCDNPSRW